MGYVFVGLVVVAAVVLYLRSRPRVPVKVGSAGSQPEKGSGPTRPV